MYWRIDCTEHLLLNIRDDPASGPSRLSPRAETNGGQPRSGRPRSTTYSTGSIGPGSAQSLAKHQAAAVDRGHFSDSPSVVRWAGSPDGRLLAGVTRLGVYLWLVKPFVQLSSLVYDPVEEFGQFVDVIWGLGSGDTGMLFAVTSMGYIYEIAVYRRDGPALEYQFSAQHYYVRGPGEAEGIASLGIAQKRTFKLPGAGAAVCATAAGPEMAMVSTRSHVYRLTWAGAVISTTGVRDIYDNPLAQVRQMLHIDGDVQTELYLFSDGSIHVLSCSGSDAVVRRLEQPGMAEKFTVLSYNPASRIVAVGTTSSEVLLYTMGSREQGLELITQLALDHDKAAHVTALAWTPDGSALACGYSTGHVVMRTVLGFELNATRLSSQALPEFLVPSPRLLHWAPGATRLYVFSDCVAAGDSLCAQQGDVLPFVRAALNVVACEGNSKRVCMFSDDKVLLHHCEFEAHDLASQQPELLWHVAHVPPDYISSNWPLRYVATDSEGLHIAVAGKNGLACYSVASHKWRLFRNQQQEASISCVGGLLWYREYLIVASINHECGDSPQILFFPRTRPLDTTSDLQTVALESPVVTMSCHNSILLVLCENNVLYQYAIFDDMNFIQVSFRREIALDQFGVDPLRVRSLQWVPSALFDGRPVFLVHEGIELKVIGEGLGDGGSVVVSARVEFAITSGVNFGNMHSTVWWFSGTHLYASLISLEDFMDGGTGPLVDGARRRMMRIRPEFFPVAISADKGMAVGLDQDWTLEEHAVIGLGKLPIRAKLYLHNILDHMLSDGAEQDALMYAACFEHLEFFSHAMEILLHEVLEREMDQSLAISGVDAVLPRVVALLENFSAFHEIVVHCARKTEAAFWSHLFACVGGPERFFRLCLDSNQLETATQSLIILQTLEPASVNEDNILALLGKVVAAKNKDLCLEILRFLKMTSESDLTMKRLLDRLRQ
ncbi:WD40 repeat protein [Coemansia sp. RSA 922]|nr:WD40 repeat protein [Coemansia sp. S3946]KAJ2048426.1 WD40 repeat protein [Coemansia sp. S16]KAJ2074028.1 WD40 repeat protein [Coemansia sp. S155-1]KAJ2110338.1 WD40 repeat protein [Coemansia sp. RSA 922]